MATTGHCQIGRIAWVNLRNRQLFQCFGGLHNTSRPCHRPGIYRNGCSGYLHGRDSGQVKQSQEALEANAGVSGGLGSDSGCQRVLDQLGKLDSVDVLINNADIFSVENFFAIDDEWLRYFQLSDCVVH
jgi:hypothetical protein